MLGLIDWEMPRRAVFGVNSVDTLPQHLRQLKSKKAFLVTDENLVKFGLLRKIVEHLNSQGVSIETFDKITSEPSTDMLRRAVTALRAAKYDLVIGVGGGSCLDSAKVCAALATNPGDVEDYYSWSEDKVREKALPKMLIPTTSGTGSEVDNGAVIIDKGYKTVIVSSNLLADVAVVDPAMTLTLPSTQTAYSGMDALSHVVEGLVSRQVSPMTDALALEATKLISANLRAAYYSGENLDARSGMSLAAMLAGFIQSIPGFTGSYLGHCIAELIGPRYNIPHGLACAVALPHMMRFALPATVDRLALIGSAISRKIRRLSKRDAALESVRQVVDLLRDLDLPVGLKQLGIPRGDLPRLSETISKELQYRYGLSTYFPRKLTLENMTRLLDGAWEGRIE